MLLCAVRHQLYELNKIYLYELSTKLDNNLVFFISFLPNSPDQCHQLNHFYHKMCFLFALKSSLLILPVSCLLSAHQSTK